MDLQLKPINFLDGGDLSESSSVCSPLLGATTAGDRRSGWGQVKLTPQECAAVTKRYSRAGLLNSVPRILHFLSSFLSFSRTEDELGEMLAAKGYLEGRAVPLEIVLSLVEEFKQDHRRITKDDDADTLAAFVAMGGSADKSGTVSSESLLDSVSHFDFGDDLSSVLPRGKPRPLTYVEFENVFEYARLVYSTSTSDFVGVDSGTPREGDVRNDRRYPEETVEFTHEDYLPDESPQLDQDGQAAGGGQPAMDTESPANVAPQAGKSTHRLRWASSIRGSHRTGGSSEDRDSSKDRRHLADRIVKRHHALMADKMSSRPAMSQLMKGTFDTTLTIMSPAGELAPHLKPKEKPRDIVPTMVDREKRKMDQQIAELHEVIEAEASRRLAEGRKGCLTRISFEKSRTGEQRKILFHPKKERKTLIERQSEPPGGTGEDNFVRLIAQEAFRAQNADVLAMRQQKKRSVQWKARKQKQVFGFTSPLGREEEIPRVSPTDLGKVLRLRILSDYSEPKKVKLLAKTPEDVVAAASDAVGVLPRNHFVSDVWYATPDGTFLPVSNIQDLPPAPTEVTVRALVFVPPTASAEQRPKSGLLSFPHVAGRLNRQASPVSGQQKDEEGPRELQPGVREDDGEGGNPPSVPADAKTPSGGAAGTTETGDVHESEPPAPTLVVSGA